MREFPGVPVPQLHAFKRIPPISIALPPVRVHSIVTFTRDAPAGTVTVACCWVHSGFLLKTRVSASFRPRRTETSPRCRPQDVRVSRPKRYSRLFPDRPTHQRCRLSRHSVQSGKHRWHQVLRRSGPLLPAACRIRPERRPHSDRHSIRETHSLKRIRSLYDRESSAHSEYVLTGTRLSLHQDSIRSTRSR